MPFAHKPDRELAVPPGKAVSSARRHMRRAGWSYRAAAKHLGCSNTHLALVLTGRRESRSLLQRIHALPTRN